MAKPVNNYGMEAAKKRAREKAAKQAAQNEKYQGQTAVRRKPVPKAPNLDWTPMAHPGIDWNARRINWDDVSTDTNARTMADNLMNSPAKMQLLSMPTGTGKTAITIATIGHLQKLVGETIPVVISAPKKVYEGLGWHNTIADYNAAHPDNPLDVVLITTVDKLASALAHPQTARQLLKRSRGGIVVLDEVHKYKTPTSKRTKQLSKMAGLRKIGVSATPLTNDIVTDMMSYLIIAGFYMNKTEFENKTGLIQWKGKHGVYTVYNEKTGEVNRIKWPQFEYVLGMFSEVLYAPSVTLSTLNMPQLVTQIEQLPYQEQLGEDVRSLYYAHRKRMFDDFIDFKMALVERMHNDRARLDKLVEIIQRPGVVQPLIFYRNVVVKDAILEHFSAAGITGVQVVDGSSMSDFSTLDHTSSAPVLIQYQSGAEGIELKSSNTSIFYQNEPSYSAIVQSRGRNIRRNMNHDEDITHYYILSHLAVDKETYDISRRRELVSTGVVEEVSEMDLEIRKLGDDSEKLMDYIIEQTAQDILK